VSHASLYLSFEPSIDHLSTIFIVSNPLCLSNNLMIEKFARICLVI